MELEYDKVFPSLLFNKINSNLVPLKVSFCQTIHFIQYLIGLLAQGHVQVCDMLPDRKGEGSSCS